MTDKKLLEVTEFPITDVNGREIYLGEKRIIGFSHGQTNLLAVRLEGGGELPDGLKGHLFTNMKLCREVVGNFIRKQAAEEAAKAAAPSKEELAAERRQARLDDAAERKAAKKAKAQEEK